MYLNSLQPLIW